MEMNDVLTDPCPQCALKHLSTALSRVVDRPIKCVETLSWRVRLHVGVAYVNYIEYLEGYESHLPYVLGKLVEAEEHAAEDNENPAAIRALRVALVESPRDPHLASRFANFMPDMVSAHLHEALRELPQLGDIEPTVENGLFRLDTVDWLQRAIAWVRENFFDSGDAPGGAAGMKQEPPTESEPAMATAKKAPAKKAPVKATVKKADPKAKQAACKGGCAKKGKK